MWTSVNEVLEYARAISTPNKVGHAVLFEVQRKEAHIKPTKPFNNRIKEDTWAVVEGDSNTTSDTLRPAALKILISILDHQLKRGQYENAIAYTQSQYDVARQAATTDEGAADDGIESLFVYVRRMVQRFITRTPGAPQAEPTPMDWILETRTRRNRLDQLSDMLHGVVNEARLLLAQLTIVTGGDEQGDAVSDSSQARSCLDEALPRIHWPSIEDDHSETREGYSFLYDDRNAWLREGDGWVFRRIVGSQPRRRGQPGRATEIGSLRVANMVNGGEAEGITKQAHHYSAFLWADEVTQKRSGGGAATVTSVDIDNAGDTAEDGDKGRAASRLLGNKLNVSMWRHIAIAIANRFLHEAFGRWDLGKKGDDEDEDELGDSPGVAAKQQQFRKVSSQWHRFLGFGDEDRASDGYRSGSKRKVELYDGVRLEARLRRFARLQQADMAGRLRQMTGDDAATFRGNQAKVVGAIVNGHSPIIQVMGTGSGRIHYLRYA
ncbi:hypothetical protein BDP81DRAFT_455618 [Colletotrichum phormii]|uniref:Uncharacterized protein n=1 Tax=Colletotrichum phormii TaxID=359342 RepID=A0AAI9ZCL4_9PEZI|nr:uncharacterized protein BDP81DRAFT_455618 [Colletotrichum phormii]KAK1622054.1 hypothetical protein BDP81DRAFT_455618 [Colletotrichum phormii]